jgi:hypothetical protein
VDADWALRQLREFVTLTTLVQPPRTPGITVFGDVRHIQGPLDQVVSSAQVVEQILDRVLRGWRETVPPDPHSRWQQERQAAQRAIVQLERAAEIRDKLGDNAPQLDAGNMHPWAWEGARSLWQSGHYREAVRAASVKLNAETQNKLGRRDVSEVALFQSAYSRDDAKPGQPRLRLPNDDGGQTALSERRGVMALAEGCFAALRNPASHDPLDELPEAEALEQLATISLLARFVDRSRVVLQ